MAAFVPLMQLANGYQCSQVLFTVAKFGFADILLEGPLSGEELAAKAHTNEENTTRLLRAAAALGIFNRDPTTLKYTLNDLSKLLLDGPGSLKWVVLHTAEPACVRPWLHLDTTVQNGSYAFNAEYPGLNCFEYYAKNPESAARFDGAMTAFSAILPVPKALQEHYNGLKDAKHLIDVGGGQGRLTIEILRLFPHLKGTSYDLAQVVEDAKAKKVIDHSDVASRFSYAAGSFFDSVPPGGDIYTLKFIIHDWEDAKAIEILKNVAKVLPANGKIVVLDQVIKETNDPRGGLLDLHMMVLNNAKERNEKQFHQIFNAAGLKITQIVPLPPTFIYAIEGVKN